MHSLTFENWGLIFVLPQQAERESNGKRNRIILKIVIWKLFLPVLILDATLLGLLTLCSMLLTAELLFQ
jgi:hypothetical protein